MQKIKEQVCEGKFLPRATLHIDQCALIMKVRSRNEHLHKMDSFTCKLHDVGQDRLENEAIALGISAQQSLGNRSSTFR